MKRLLLFTTLFSFSLIGSSQTKETLTVNFDFNKSELTKEALAKLDGFISKITPLSIGSIQLSGYCDSKGSNAYNDALSLRRVNTVKHYLENNKSIKALTLMAKGFGENGLLNSDLTDEDGLQNRRVEIIVTVQEEPKAVEQKAAISNETPAAAPIKETRSLTTILEDTTVKKGSTIALQNLEFENSSDVLLSKSIPTLQELYDILVKYPKMTIAIEGHICCVVRIDGVRFEDSPSYIVSVMRAKKVYAYLIEKGIDPHRLSYIGFGNSHPIYAIPEKSEEERIANRRVEIRIVEK
ncbi:MAG: OmpA family protein [Ferruginibacter sp.]